MGDNAMKIVDNLFNFELFYIRKLNIWDILKNKL